MSNHSRKNLENFLDNAGITRLAMPPAFGQFEHGGIQLWGVSHAGEMTCIVAPQLNLAFDIGYVDREVLSVDHVFLSHGHMDHAAGIAYYFSQRMFIDNRPGTLYAPQPLVAPIRDLLRIWADIDGNEPPATIIAASPLVDIPIRKDLVVRPFEVNHPGRTRERGRVNALGYAAIEIRQKLIDEYQGLNGPQLVELKRQGVEITKRVEIPLIAYCGDTAAGAFLEHDFVRQSRVLLLECTFVDADHRDRARSGFHLHVSDLNGILQKIDSEKIVLIHLSRRTALEEARQRVAEAIGPSLAARVSFFMESRRRRPRVSREALN